MIMRNSRIAYIDAFAGASGDMLLGALLDLGLPTDILAEGWRMLGLKGIEVRPRKVLRSGVSGCLVEIEDAGKTGIRGYGQMRSMIEASSLPDGVKKLSLKILGRLAQAEAVIHSLPVDEVHFHELSGLDTIVDAVGFSLGVNYFSWEKIISSPLPLGRGFVDSQHGRLPLPAPATLALLNGVPVVPAPCDGETVTPTGAAIITAVASGFGSLPEMEVTGCGYGAGNKDPAEVPNLLRIIHGRQKEEGGEGIWVLEADLDDMTPELLPYLSQLLLANGGVDVCMIPIQMKKGRPGITIRCLAAAAQKEKLAQVVLRESTSIGVRMYPVDRLTLKREVHEVKTKYGTIKIKVAFDEQGGVINLMPEYESCRLAAEAKGVPLKEVYQEAITRGRESIKNRGE